MQRFGAGLLALGIIGFLWAFTGLGSMRLLQWLPRDQQMIAGAGMAAVGLVLLGIGRLVSPKEPAQPAPPPAAAPPPGWVPPPQGAPAVRPPAQYAVAPPPPDTKPGQHHSPIVALIVALLIPGAGQAYNGKPMRGFFLVLLLALATGLLIPRWPAAFSLESLSMMAKILVGVLAVFWLGSVLGAVAGASRIRSSLGRMGKGGFIWVFLQLWLVVNAVGFVAVGLTIGGVLR